MARYFFHSRDGEVHHDEDGAELADLTAAKEAAAQFLSEALNKNPGLIWNTQHYTITVTDAAGSELFVLDLAAIMAPGVA